MNEYDTDTNFAFVAAPFRFRIVSLFGVIFIASCCRSLLRSHSIINQLYTNQYQWLLSNCLLMHLSDSRENHLLRSARIIRYTVRPYLYPIFIHVFKYILFYYKIKYIELFCVQGNLNQFSNYGTVQFEKSVEEPKSFYQSIEHVKVL